MANALSKVQGLPYFDDLYGNALDMGEVYIGQPNTDPRQNPITVYYDEAQTIPVPQPIKTLQGRLTKAGSIAEIFVNPPYSIYVEDQRGAQVYYEPNVIDPIVTAVGQLSTVVANNIAALRAINPANNQTVNVLSYYSANGVPDGGGGLYVYDPTDVTTPDNGGAVIVGVGNARWKLRQTGWVCVRQFGAKGDGTTDDTAAITAAQTFAYAQTILGGAYPLPWRVEFASGVYNYTLSPNWAQNGAKVVARGRVTLRNKGTGNAVIIDAGATLGAFLQDIQFGEQSNPFTIESPTGAGHGIFARGLNTGCVVSAVVRGAGATSAGLLTNGCIITTFNVQVAPYTTGWYNDGAGAAKPQFGYILNLRNAGEQTSYCTFINPQAAACQYGLWLDGTLGNVFIGGDCEFNTTQGMLLTANAFHNKFYGMDFEQNGTPAGSGIDVTCAGSYNIFSVDTGSGGATGGFRFVTGSVGNKLVGGTHDGVAVDAGNGNFIGGITYQRGLSGNLPIVDNGTLTAFGKNWAAQQAKYTFGPRKSTALTLPAAPASYTYTNTSAMTRKVMVSGGTFSVFQYIFNGSATYTATAGAGIYDVEPGDSLQMTYSVIPTIIEVTL